MPHRLAGGLCVAGGGGPVLFADPAAAHGLAGIHRRSNRRRAQRRRVVFGREKRLLGLQPGRPGSVAAIVPQPREPRLPAARDDSPAAVLAVLRGHAQAVDRRLQSCLRSPAATAGGISGGSCHAQTDHRPAACLPGWPALSDPVRHRRRAVRHRPVHPRRDPLRRRDPARAGRRAARRVEEEAAGARLGTGLAVGVRDRSEHARAAARNRFVTQYRADSARVR